MNYNQLITEDRYTIARLLKQRLSQQKLPSSSIEATSPSAENYKETAEIAVNTLLKKRFLAHHADGMNPDENGIPVIKHYRWPLR